MPDVFLYPGEARPNDVRLLDPTLVVGPTGGFASPYWPHAGFLSGGGSTTTLTADTGAFILTGSAAILTPRLIAALGAYIETGLSATLTTKLVASAGAYVDTGNAATLKAVLSGGVGAYSETGRSARLTAVLRPIKGTYVLTGYAVTNPPGGEKRQFLMLLGVR